jgi:MinD superfamily P-loop ATPase
MITVEKKKIIRKKAKVLKSDCVACGACVQVCPLGVIKIVEGVFAEVNEDKCVGCGKCEMVCPASVIHLVAKEGVR